MSTNRFFISASDIKDDRVWLSPEQSHQIQHVLRLQPGDTIVVLDGSGTEYNVTLTKVDRRETEGQVTGRQQAPGEPAARVVLFQSILMREKFEWVLQKGTEVGVARFAPVLTARSLVRVKDLEDKKLDRWRRIVTEAAEQSHRGRIPEIDQIIKFDEAISSLAGFDRSLIAAPSHEGRSLRETLQGLRGRPASVAVMVGPEGGFTEEEVASACRSGAVPISLGPRILRTETCAIVAPALILHELGDMGPGGDLRFEI
jgi:16S rRNA (uracil1498-N3)-methyltransferase